MINLSFIFQELFIQTHEEVYDPAEDTFLVIEGIKIKEKQTIFEIGTGCGIIALYCAKNNAKVICSDINPFAVELTKKNYEINKKKINGTMQVRLGDMFSVIKKDEQFDIIIFNPPYLPTKKSELIGGSGWIDKALNGGNNGLKYTTIFIEKLPKYLNKNGKAYFIFSTLSDKKELMEKIDENNFQSEVIKKYDFHNESLQLICLKR